MAERDTLDGSDIFIGTIHATPAATCSLTREHCITNILNTGTLHH